MLIQDSQPLYPATGYLGQLLQDISTSQHRETTCLEGTWILLCILAAEGITASFSSSINIPNQEFLTYACQSAVILVSAVAGYGVGRVTANHATLFANKVRAACAECDNYQEIPGHQP
jgi:hypothetical protein